MLEYYELKALDHLDSHQQKYDINNIIEEEFKEGDDFYQPSARDTFQFGN